MFTFIKKIILVFNCLTCSAMCVENCVNCISPILIKSIFLHFCLVFFHILPSYRITWICPMTFDNFPLDVQVLWYWTVPENQSKSTLFIG